MNPSTPEKNFLFVYGTLRKDTNHPAHKIYLNNSSFFGYAKVHGDLYMIDYYPGLVVSANNHWVQGEVYCLENAEDLQRLDVYEACSDNCAQPHEYERRLVATQLDSGELLQTWTYVFILPTIDYSIIPSGDFLKLPL